LAADPTFKLRQRAEHVIAEAQRVDQAVEALRQSDWPRLAELIAASHASCRNLYEISCPELERLVTAAGEAGALASRLTGAGFGGCTLHLVRRSEADHFASVMKRRLGESLRMWKVAPSSGAEAV
jgi:galactokinase